MIPYVQLSFKKVLAKKPATKFIKMENVPAIRAQP